MRTRRISRIAITLALVLPVLGAEAVAEDSNLLIYNTEGNRLRRYDADTIGGERLVEEVLIERGSRGEFASPSGPGRDINGQICLFPDGSGRFVAGEDTGQPNPRAGWGIFEADGQQSGKLTATYLADLIPRLEFTHIDRCTLHRRQRFRRARMTFTTGLFGFKPHFYPILANYICLKTAAGVTPAVYNIGQD